MYDVLQLSQIKKKTTGIMNLTDVVTSFKYKIVEKFRKISLYVTFIREEWLMYCCHVHSVGLTLRIGETRFKIDVKIWCENIVLLT